ncbi:MAG TPA: energy transducer TonB [Pyrinomonadaceae bacterium]|nr:energy transducer TonB [Pyrinomonadaceae bacterium]
MRRVFVIAGLLALLVSSARAQKATVSVLDFGTTPFAQKISDTLRTRLTNEFTVADADMTRAAATGGAYSGSLNLTVSEARDLGAVLGSEFYILGDAQTLRRSSFSKPAYYESYCSIFLVSARTGRLATWIRPTVQKDDSAAAEAELSQQLSNAEMIDKIVIAIRRARDDDRAQRSLVVTASEPLIEEAPEDERAAEVQGLRMPRPYRRLRPEYPDSAARADAEATVDVLVDVRADGEVADVQIARWAGFGLDETTVATVRQMHFFPAMKNGSPIAMRVLLRYNFRKPPR